MIPHINISLIAFTFQNYNVQKRLDWFDLQELVFHAKKKEKNVTNIMSQDRTCIMLLPCSEKDFRHKEFGTAPIEALPARCQRL